MSFFDMLRFVHALVMPPRCKFCYDVVPIGSGDVCAECAKKLPAVRLTGALRRGFCRSERHDDRLDELMSSYIYRNPVDCCVRGFKNRRLYHLADSLASVVADDLRATGIADKLDLVTFVPQRQRGRVHSKKLADSLAKNLALPCRQVLLARHRLDTQHYLSAKQRVGNLKGAFAGDPAVAGLRVLVVDDVVTSGATLNEAARALKAAGAREVYGATLAAAEYKRG